MSTSTGISGCFQPGQAKVVLGPTPLSITSPPFVQVGPAAADGDEPAAVERRGQPHHGGPAPSPLGGRRQPAAQRRACLNRGHGLLHHRTEGLCGRRQAGPHTVHRHVFVVQLHIRLNVEGTRTVYSSEARICLVQLHNTLEC